MEIKKIKDDVNNVASVGDVCYINLRAYGELWYQRLDIPDTLHRVYVLKCVCIKALRNKSRSTIRVELFEQELSLDNYLMYVHIVSSNDPSVVVVDADFAKRYPVVMNTKAVSTSGKAL